MDKVALLRWRPFWTSWRDPLELQGSLQGKERGQGGQEGRGLHAEVAASDQDPGHVAGRQELGKGCTERVPRVSGGMQSRQHLACSLGKLSLVLCPLDL